MSRIRRERKRLSLPALRKARVDRQVDRMLAGYGYVYPALGVKGSTLDEGYVRVRDWPYRNREKQARS